MDILSEPLSIEYLTCAIAGLPENLQGSKLVQLTDFHYDGLLLSEQLLTQAIEATNQAKPDLVVLTGDFVTHIPSPIHKLAERLKRLQRRDAIFALVGHEAPYVKY